MTRSSFSKKITRHRSVQFQIHATDSEQELI
jgi:hypothetical protein